MCKHKHYTGCKIPNKTDKLKGFLIHLLVFILVSVGQVVVNLLTTPQYLWFGWSLMGWGIGVLSHGLATPGLGWVLRGGKKPAFLGE